MASVFNFMSPIAWIGVGIIVTFLLLVALKNGVIHGIKHVTRSRVSEISEEERLSKDDWSFYKKMHDEHYRQ